MKRVRVEIQGLTPMLCNRFHDEAQIAATEGKSLSSAAREPETPQEECKKKLYIGTDGKPIIPSPNLFRALIDAGTFFKVGKNKITTVRTSMVPSGLAIEEIEISIKHKEPWKVDTRPIRNPATGGRRLCHRPCFDDWELAFTLSIDPEIFSEKLVRDLVDAAGKRIGLGDFRPACKGPFGRFVVTKWQGAK
jgi:hypothetical protein